MNYHQRKKFIEYFMLLLYDWKLKKKMCVKKKGILKI